MRARLRQVSLCLLKALIKWCIHVANALIYLFSLCMRCNAHTHPETVCLPQTCVHANSQNISTLPASVSLFPIVDPIVDLHIYGHFCFSCVHKPNQPNCNAAQTHHLCTLSHLSGNNTPKMCALRSGDSGILPWQNQCFYRGGKAFLGGMWGSDTNISPLAVSYLRDALCDSMNKAHFTCSYT